MKVMLLNPQTIDASIGDLPCAAFREFEHIARRSRSSNFAVTLKAEEADLILAPIQFNGFGLFFRKLRDSVFYRRYQSRVYVYCPDDNVYPSIPGVYPSVSHEFVQANWARAGHYLSSHIHKFDFPAAPVVEKDIECSFAGSTYTHAIRREIAALGDQGVTVFDASASAQTPWYSRATTQVEDARMRFREILERSLFTICPRGEAPSSIRLFEAMQASCVPIIVSDAQVLPQGPQWEACCIRVPESEVSRIPEHVAAYREHASQMGAAARREWEAYFAPESGFETICRAVESIHVSMEADRVQREREIAIRKYGKLANLRALCRDWKTRLQGAERKK